MKSKEKRKKKIQNKFALFANCIPNTTHIATISAIPKHLFALHCMIAILCDVYKLNST